jgi:hypothetical protein
MLIRATSSALVASVIWVLLAITGGFTIIWLSVNLPSGSPLTGIGESGIITGILLPILAIIPLYLAAFSWRAAIVQLGPTVAGARTEAHITTSPGYSSRNVGLVLAFVLAFCPVFVLLSFAETYAPGLTNAEFYAAFALPAVVLTGMTVIACVVAILASAYVSEVVRAFEPANPLSELARLNRWLRWSVWSGLVAPAALWVGTQTNFLTLESIGLVFLAIPGPIVCVYVFNRFRKLLLNVSSQLPVESSQTPAQPLPAIGPYSLPRSPAPSGTLTWPGAGPLGSGSPASRPTAAELRRQSKLWGAVAFAGLGLVILSLLLRSFIPIYVSVLGFALLIAGVAGLLVLTRREQLRPTGSAPMPPVPEWGAPLDLVPRPATLGATQVDLSRSTKFELGIEYQAYKRSMRFAVYFRVGAYLWFLGIALLLLVEGVLRRDGVLIGLGAGLAAVPLFGFTVLRSVNRGVTELTVGPDGLAVELDAPMSVLLRWNDPRFGLRITETPPEVNRQRDPPRDETTYRLFTGPGSGVGQPPRILTDIPVDCLNAILAFANSRGLQIVPGTSGVPGTMSARRTYRVAPPAAMTRH